MIYNIFQVYNIGLAVGLESGDYLSYNLDVICYYLDHTFLTTFNLYTVYIIKYIVC